MNSVAKQNAKEKFNLRIKQCVREISTWPTDVASIDYINEETNQPHVPHTIFLFIPGNPGCIGWYIDMLHDIVKKLGLGYAARAVSYAGHGVGDDLINTATQRIEGDVDDVLDEQLQMKLQVRSKEKIAFTVEGQVEHKIAWVDDLLSSESMTSQSEDCSNENEHKIRTNNSNKKQGMKFIFLTHSIGAHLVQQMLLLRKDILHQTKLVIHITPFHRFDPESTWQQNYLATVANAPSQAISLLKLMCYLISLLPPTFVDLYMEKVAGMPLEKDRKLAIDLYTQPRYVSNFLTLGTEEIRDLPHVHDLAAMRIIGNSCPTSILYCLNDHWAPLFHMDDIVQAQKDSLLPGNITVECNKNMEHGFIVFPDSVLDVVNFVIRSVRSVKDENQTLISKL